MSTPNERDQNNDGKVGKCDPHCHGAARYGHRAAADSVFYLPQPFGTLPELLTAIALLGLVPLLAYPLQPISPHYRQKGGGQRSLPLCLPEWGTPSPFYGHCRQALRLQSAPFAPATSRRCCLPFATRCFTGAPASMRAAVGPLLFLIYYFGWWRCCPVLSLPPSLRGLR